MVAAEFSKPSDDLAVQRDTENFEWFLCSNCNKVFMAEATTKKGHCPYCQYQMMLETESKRISGKGSDESEFICFFSPECGNIFFANDTQQMGTCPYCREPIDLTAPVSTDLEQPPPKLLAWVGNHAKGLFAIALGVFAVSMTGFYFLRERQVMLSLSPIDTAASEDSTIELSRHHLRKKELFLSGKEDADIVLKNPALRDLQLILSFVRVGGKTHSYLHQKSNHAIQVNDRPEFNPRLKDHDKVQLGDVVFEVYARED
jgi:DNA-directed RNA polymerase subunit RPC12/RpoP